jgi:outer membrane protein TolC
MKLWSPLLAMLVSALLILGTSNWCRAQGLDQLLPKADVGKSTSTHEVLSGNPIKLTITKEAPAADLPDVTGNYSLDQAVKVGLEHNLDLSQLGSATKIAAANTLTALARFGPMISFNPFYTVSSLSQMGFYPNDGLGLLATPMQPIVNGNSLSVIFSGMQPLYTGGALKGIYKATKAIEKQSLSAHQAGRIETSRKIKETYWKAAWNEAKLRVDSDYVKFRAWSSANIKEKMLVGKVPRADYLREEAELAKARAQLNQAYREFNISLIQLKVVMGANIASLITLSDPLEFAESSTDLSNYMKMAALNRPEIKQAQSRIAEMKGKQLMARSNYLPHVDLWGLGSNITGSSPDGNASGRWGGMVEVVGHLTLFDSGRRRGELRAATEAIRQAEFASQQVQLKVAQDVSEAWVELDLAKRNVELAKAQVVSAEEDQRLWQARYNIGKAIALEAFDASVKLFQARLSLLEAIYQYRLAQTRITWASGNI